MIYSSPLLLVNVPNRRRDLQYFLAIVVLGCAFLALVSLRARVLRWSLSGALGLLVLAFFIFSHQHVSTMGPNHTFQASPLKELIFFAAMILGMVAKYFWDLIEERRKTTPDDRSGRRPLHFDTWEFIQPLLVSGIVFAALLSMLKELTLPSVLLSFQNGFFWQTVLKKQGS
jgi:DMSO reductase anchor subunit